MHAIVRRLAAGGEPPTVDDWHGFWDGLKQGSGQDARDDALGLLDVLGRRLPAPTTVGALVDALDERRPHPPPLHAVNVVGTGGGPPTFNVSTAAALVAATLGVPVVKSGSRAYTSRLGSVDMLRLLGVPLAQSHEAAAAAVDRFGIAFTGAFVYPAELRVLARRILPADLRTLGGFFNRIGPFLATVPATRQVTGVSDPQLLPLLEHLAAHHCRRRTWLCVNPVGVDELVSFEVNSVRLGGAAEIRLTPGALGLAGGSLADLRAPESAGAAVRHFEGLLRGEGPVAAIESLALNAACLAVAAGPSADWRGLLRAASQALDEGRPFALLEELRSAGTSRLHRARRSAPAPVFDG